MAITNTAKTTSLSTEYLNMTNTSGISPSGYWFFYTPVNANNTVLGATITPYRWNVALPLINSTSNIAMEGTMPLITESWEGANVKYHGSSIEWIGAGVNDITGTQESDAFFFGHLGTLSTAPDDDAFYWDRLYLAVGGAEWEYYQYHKHLPLFYPQYENGRQVQSARGYINPADKAYGYMINSRIRVSGTDYASIIARIHTPSIGGAHNSHNDVTLPSVSTKNYMPGGILKGNSNRFHAFYIAANGAQWDVFTRTYTETSLSFSAEVNLGTYDLADPLFNPIALTGVESLYPVRASAGTVYDTRIYFPMIFNNATSGFDLKIWSLNSLDTIAGGSLLQYTIATGVAVRPDCHLKVFNDVLYAVYTNPTAGGVALQSFNGTTWTTEGQVVNNSNTKYVRVHGFEYNSADTKFYTLLSGTSLGGNTYTGPGLYSFELTGTFSGYKHLDYDSTTNSYISKAALALGHLQYNQIDATITKSNTAEPAGISIGTNILEYTLASPQFINRKEAILGGEEYYYQGIQLRDGRKMLAGRIVGNEDNFGTGTAGDLLVSIFLDTDADPHHLAWGGAGDDYITGIYEDPTESKVWMTGYTKSELVPKKDIKVHGFCRNFTDGANQMAFVDVAIDAAGNMFAVGTHSSGYIILMKFDANYELVWQTSFDGGTSGVDVAYGITLGTDGTIYICGSTTNVGAGGSDALFIKATSAGRLMSTTIWGTASGEYASSIATVRNSGTDYLIMSIVSGTNTIFTVVDTDGSVVELNDVANLIVNRIRPDTGNTNIGQFVFAGNNGAGTPVAKFGMGRIQDPTAMIKWVQTYSDGATASYANDISNIDADEYAIAGTTSTSGLLLKVQVSGTTVTKTWARKIATSTFNSLAVNSLGEIHVVGYTTASGISTMGMDDGYIVKFAADGTLLWQNAFGHDMSERLVAVVMDPSQENIVSVGWSESHSFGRDAILFRSWTGGYGTGYYHIEGNPGVPYIYQATALTASTDASSLTTITAPADVAGTLTTTGGVFTTFTGNAYTVSNEGTNNYVFNGGGLTNATDPTLTLARGGTYTFTMAYSGNHPFYIKTAATVGTGDTYNSGVTNNGATAGVTLTFAVPINAPDILYYKCGNHSGMGGIINIIDNPSLSNGFTQNDYGFLPNVYDGSYGTNGVFQYWMGYLDLNAVQTYLNSDQHRQNMANGVKVDYTSSIFTFYQVATVGDSTADDGNIFGYDIIKHSNGKIYAIGQTSGDVGKTNTGASGVYDYILIELDPVTETLSYYQNGTSLDEETYALTELADGTIAYTGRTSGNLGSANLGGYDIFLGIFNPTTETSSYYSTGTGLDDKGVNVHDIGGNVLAVVYSSYGAVGSTTNVGTEDIGVILFNYVTDTWGTAYQTGSATSEFFEQNGKPSVLLADGRIAITCSSAGTFADDAVTYGFLDLCVAILDRTDGTWRKFQVGSGASDFASSVATTGDRLLITGYSRATFADKEINGIAVEFDVLNAVGAKASVI